MKNINSGDAEQIGIYVTESKFNNQECRVKINRVEKEILFFCSTEEVALMLWK